MSSVEEDSELNINFKLLFFFFLLLTCPVVIVQSTSSAISGDCPYSVLLHFYFPQHRILICDPFCTFFLFAFPHFLAILPALEILTQIQKWSIPSQLQRKDCSNVLILDLYRHTMWQQIRKRDDFQNFLIGLNQTLSVLTEAAAQSTQCCH